MSDVRAHPTLLAAVRASLAHAARFNPGDMVAPAAVLWTDADGQWEPLVEQMRPQCPDLFTLGDYNHDARTGPAIWLRTVIEPAVRADNFPDLAWPDCTVPVIYLPNVGRQTLRAIEDCPEPLLPLVELQYRGVVWTQKNGKDWTIRAFLVNDEDGLGLDVAEDKLTLQAMQGALSQLSVIPVARLRGKRLEAEDFDKLMIGDTPRDLLLWLSSPEGTRGQWDQGKWDAFRNRCRQDYGFDPESDGTIVGGEKLGQRKDAWLGVWERFMESPALYPGVPDLLRRAKPRERLTFDKEPWPDENDAMESTLRTALKQIGSMKPDEARQRLEQLEAEHGPRRGWVWAKLGQSTLAKALTHLAALATRTATVLGGDSPKAMAQLYVDSGYLADDAALRALAEVKNAEDWDAVSAAARAVYLPWLRDAAEHFQKLAASTPLLAKGDGADDIVAAEPGTCILFVDGLRFDLGQRLAGLAQDRNLRVGGGRRWAAVPTVTGTAKPAVTPVAGQVSGHQLGEDFVPEVSDAGKPATTDRIRKLMVTAGYQVLTAPDVGQPQSGRAWTEYGEFDSLGHSLQAKLAQRVEEQLGLLMDRIEALLKAGWQHVRVVTDHGWLLVPGGLPNTPLPKYLTISRWSRCATIKAGSHVQVPTAGWYWNPNEVFAFGPDISVFSGSYEYTHGGVSLQECVVPDLFFSRDVAAAEIKANIADVQWLGMRCRVTVEPAGLLVTADIRTKVGDGTSSIATPKAVDDQGKAGLLVENDQYDGTTVSVVLLDNFGHVLAKRATSVGGED
jgi:hypothetical protein